ncbi:DUF1254 domain-containing protein [Pseudomonas sp. GD03860]|uniref:DUF1254 domain-containing protein n=1 Tax=Pseudomonas TaxID=286 RepID=UPI002363BD4F|nr:MULTISPECIES: DUF1254 domain-containing protein [Pseudomonas]MDD2058513.1 DUF1254 domain-containing protein [Pseudomonas putida]MDH0640671.1 DUF1254 domain-containing protein [Pseudomonas sp. GD03860]
MTTRFALPPFIGRTKVAATLVLLALLLVVLHKAPASANQPEVGTRLLEGRALEAAIWGMPLANFNAMRQAYFRDAGAKYNDIMYWSRPSDWRNQTTTPNHSTLYVMFFVNLKDGPVVVDIPATRDAGLYGTLIDAWTTPLVNVGNNGDDQGKGGRYLLLPPGFEGQVPAGYIAVPSKTFNNYSLLRVITRSVAEKDLAAGVDYLKNLKVYPLASADQAPANRFIDMADKVYDAIARFDDSYYDSLAAMVAEEPLQERDVAIMGQFRSLDIGKGLNFNPDAQRRDMLKVAARQAQAYLMKGYEESGLAIWGDQRKWRTLANPKSTLPSKVTFVLPQQGLLLDERAFAWFAMFGPVVPPSPHVYMKSYQTATGQPLDGGKRYRLRIPADAPANEFWSVDAYDASTGGFIRKAPVVGLDSYDQKLKRNADGTVDLYFAPEPPAGQESNWISTQPGQRFFTLFRIYGPKPTMKDRSWVLNDIEQIN